MKIMENPQFYKMIKEKEDGLKIGNLKFPILFKDTFYPFPKDIGDDLVKQGYAIAVKDIKTSYVNI